MKICFALIVSVVLLSSCANCHVATFYKPSISEDSRLRMDSSVPTYVSITLGDVPVAIQICDGISLSSPNNEAALCISLKLDQATTMRFTKPTVKLGVGAAISKTVSMTSVEYEIFCRVEKEVRKCSSSEEKPVIGDVIKISTTGMLNRYAFNPSLEFHGAKDTLHEGAWFGHRLTEKRQYYIRTVSTPVERGEELSVQLPEMIINGKAHMPPKMKFRTVTEEVCRMIPLAWGRLRPISIGALPRLFREGIELNKGDVVSILKLAQDQKLPENLNSNSGLNLDCVKDFIERRLIKLVLETVATDWLQIAQTDPKHGLKYRHRYCQPCRSFWWLRVEGFPWQVWRHYWQWPNHQ